MAEPGTSLAQRLLDPDREIRLHAVRQAAASQDAWTLRLLLLTGALGDGSLARAVRDALVQRGPALEPLLLLEIEGPVPKARALALGLLAEVSTLAVLPRILPCLFDPSVDVRDAARRAILQFVDRAVEQAQPGQPPPPAVLEAMTALAHVARSSDTSARKAAATALLRLSLVTADGFWRAYRSLNERGRHTVHLEFLTAQSSWSLPTLYRGFLLGDRDVEARLVQLLQRHLAGDDLNRHLDEIAGLSREEQGRLALALELHGLLPLFLDALPGLKPAARNTLLDLLEFLDVGSYTRFLERCTEVDDVRFRARALRLLGQERPQATLRRAVDLLHKSDVREVLIGLELLQKEPRLEVVERVKPLLAHPNVLVQQAAAKTIFVLTKALLTQRFAELQPAAREKILSQLRRLNPNLSEDLLAEWDATTDEAERVRLAQMLAGLATEPQVEQRLDALEVGAGGKLRATLARLFGRLASPAARLRRLVPLLYDADPRVRANAIEELPDDLPERVLTRLAEQARSDVPRERANAVRRLIQLGHHEYEITLVRMIEDADPALRASGLWVAGDLRLAHLADVLRDRLSDREPQVRRHAILALGACAPDEEIVPLERFLTDSHRAVRLAARDVLRRRLKLAFDVEE